MIVTIVWELPVELKASTRCSVGAVSCPGIPEMVPVPPSRKSPPGSSGTTVQEVASPQLVKGRFGAMVIPSWYIGLGSVYPRAQGGWTMTESVSRKVVVPALLLAVIRYSVDGEMMVGVPLMTPLEPLIVSPSVSSGSQDQVVGDPPSMEGARGMMGRSRK